MTEKETNLFALGEISGNEETTQPMSAAGEGALMEEDFPAWEDSEEENADKEGTDFETGKNAEAEDGLAASAATDGHPLFTNEMHDGEEFQTPPLANGAEDPARARHPFMTAQRRPRPARQARLSVLTIESRGEAETEKAREDTIWHEIKNAYLTRRLLTGQLGGIERTENGKTLAIVDYKGFRVVIPLKEMMIELGGAQKDPREALLRQNKLLGNMLGAQIDFIVKGIDSNARSVVASRHEAMLKKRRVFYFGTDANGKYRIHEGRIVQARVIAVAEKGVRVEAFGVECSILARDLSWEWIGDAHERYSVGDEILIRVQSVQREDPENISIKADVRSITPDAGREALSRCRPQSKYAGRVTDVRKGVVFIRLSNGANAIAHACYDYRTPGKKDDVSFAVTHIDEEKCVAVGIITRIIRQNL